MVYPERWRTVVSFDHVGAAVVKRARKAQPLLARVAALRMAGGVLRAGGADLLQEL